MVTSYSQTSCPQISYAQILRPRSMPMLAAAFAL
jgi:hypothetical protein